MTTTLRNLAIDLNSKPVPVPANVCESFHEDGFVHLPAFFGSQEVVDIQDSAALAASSGRLPTEHLGDGYRSWRAVTTVSAELIGVAADPRLVSLAIQLLGQSIRLVGSQLIHRASHQGPRFTRTPQRPGWHRDIYGMTRDLGIYAPLCAIKCAIWLTDAVNVENGATRFLPKSHKCGLPKIPRGEIDPPGWVSPAARAGDVTVFENRTAHAGGLNTSDRTLEVLMLQYGYRWLGAVAGRWHPWALVENLSPLARQVIEPDDCDPEGNYQPGPATEIIVSWATRWGLERYRNPRSAINEIIS